MARKVLIADKFPKKWAEAIRKLGLEVEANPDLKDAALTAAVPGAEILIVRSTVVSPETIAAGEALKLVIRAGSGYNTIDVDAATKAGVRVANCPGMNAIAVAELFD